MTSFRPSKTPPLDGAEDASGSGAAESRGEKPADLGGSGTRPALLPAAAVEADAEAAEAAEAEGTVAEAEFAVAAGAFESVGEAVGRALRCERLADRLRREASLCVTSHCATALSSRSNTLSTE